MYLTKLEQILNPNVLNSYCSQMAASYQRAMHSIDFLEPKYIVSELEKSR
jgi:hypothetical protein